MSLSEHELEALLVCASSAARIAGRFVRGVRPAAIDSKPGHSSLASEIVTDVDARAQELILAELEPTMGKHGGLGLLSEECVDDSSRLTSDHFWCIDPLDGTLPFVRGEPGYAISIALVSRAGEPLVGVVNLPAHDLLLTAARGLGITRNGAPWRRPRASPNGALVICADTSFDNAQEFARLIHKRTDRSVIVQSFGGAVAQAAHVLEHPPACYVKLPRSEPGGGSVWDFAATACLFSEASAAATDLFGDPLDLNRSDSTYMNHRGVVYASDATIAENARAAALELNAER